jgi:O-antigen/teichoic acid export membrane protein
VAIANAFQLFGFSTGGLLRSLQRSFLYGTFVLISEAASLVATIYLLRAGWGLYAIGMGLVIRAGVEVLGTGSSFLWISLWKLKLRPAWYGPQVRQLWKFSIYQFLTQVTGRIKTAMDSFLIGLFVGTKAGGDYTLTIRAHDTVRLASGGFTGALSSPLAHLHGEGDVPKYKEVIFTLFKVTVIAGAIGYGGVIAFNEIFMLLWLGPGVFSGTLINIIAAGAGISYSLIVVPYEALFTRAGFSAITRVVWIEVIVRIVVMIALLRWIGVLGTPVAALLCQIFGLLIPLTWINARQLRFTRKEVFNLLSSMVKLLGGPLFLAAVFAMWLHARPVTCSYVVSGGHAENVVQQLDKQFPPETGVQVGREGGSSKITVTAMPLVQKQVSAFLSLVDLSISTTSAPLATQPHGGSRPSIMINSSPSPANAWFIMIGEAALFLILCFIYTWVIDKRLVKIMLRGGRGSAA